MKNVSMQNVKFKTPSPKHQWKLAKREFGQYRRRYDFDFMYDDFQDYLDGLYGYYLDERGLSVNLDGEPVDKSSAQYMWAQLGISFNNEPLNVWMYKKNGVFGNIMFGTKPLFDAIIVEYLKSKTL